MREADRPFDPGLQPERTALAWRRTSLALVVWAFIAMRVLPALVGAWALVPSGLGAVFAIAIAVAAHLRYRKQHRRLTGSDTDRIALPDGLLPALVAVVTLAGGIVALIVVWLTHR